MPISPEHREKIRQHLEGKLKPCPMCLTDNWILQEDAFSVPTWNPPSPPVPGMLVGGGTGRMMPLFAVACANCHLVFFYPWGLVLGGLDG